MAAKLMKHLDPNCHFGVFMAARFKEILPEVEYHFMEIQGDGYVTFHIKDEDCTRYSMRIMDFVQAKDKPQ
jgi:hypothetical protein